MLYLLLVPFYVAVNIYFFYEFYKWIEVIAKLAKSEHKRKKIKTIKIVFTTLYGICAFSLMFAFAITDDMTEKSEFWRGLRRLMKLIGNYHEGVLMYLMIGFSVVAIGQGIRAVYLKIKKSQGRDIPVRHASIGLSFLAAIIAITIVGVIHAQLITSTNYSVKVNKSGNQFEKLRVVLVSDLHLGYNIGEKHMQLMVDMINEAEPDLVLIAGDIFDNEYVAIDNPDNLSALLRSINAPYGVYACYGNHDIEEPILGGFTFGNKKNKASSDEMDGFLAKSNIKLLCDEYILINDSVYIYGRPDYQRPGKNVSVRKTPAELVEGLDLSKPVIVLDHQPRELTELAGAGVDIDLCGHTHDGQLFPLNLFQKWFMWENSCGYLKKGDMHNIVTSGVGLFGPNMRVGTKAEICVIDIEFE